MDTPQILLTVLVVFIACLACSAAAASAPEQEVVGSGHHNGAFESDPLRASAPHL